MSLKERVLISWVGLRGSVLSFWPHSPSYPAWEEADMIFNVVFFVVLASVLLQGSTIPFLARRLGLDMPLEIQPEIAAKQEKDAWESLVKLKVFPGSAAEGRQIAELNIPEDTWIGLEERRPSHASGRKHGAAGRRPSDRPVRRPVFGDAQAAGGKERKANPPDQLEA